MDGSGRSAETRWAGWRFSKNDVEDKGERTYEGIDSDIACDDEDVKDDDGEHRQRELRQPDNYRPAELWN